ncbi:hypothetical protein ABZ749_15605 [Micromonospora sp. NPDC047753]|uniref:hypothetical protein n=1 Tax=Micromonospora sp. NPDC047753 TaxID=3154817 RepID=UPI0034080013
MRREEIDGVTVIQRTVPGSLAASLTFGCGARDEEIDSIGLTHLVQHLVDWTEDHIAENHQDNIWMNDTSFLAGGPPDQVVRHFATICSAISNLPPEDLSDAVEGLDADSRYMSNIEEGLRDPWGALLSRRFGPSGHGLSRWPAVDYKLFTADEIRRYVERFFTSGNAVLTVTGEPPQAMRLPLPAGPRVTRSTPLVNNQMGPIWYADEVRGVALIISVEPSVEAVFLMWALRARVAEARHRAGVAIGAEFMCEVVDSTRHELGLRVTPDFGRKGKKFDATVAAELLWAELRRLVSDGVDRVEIANLMPTQDEDLTVEVEWKDAIHSLDSLTHRELLGTAEIYCSESLSELAGLTPESARDVVSGWLSSAMIVVPYGSKPNLPRATEDSCRTTRFVPAGEVVRPPFSKRFHNKAKLVIGIDAISTVDGDGNVHTVPLSQALVVERFGVIRLAHLGHGCVTTISDFADAADKLRAVLPPRRFRQGVRQLSSSW